MKYAHSRSRHIIEKISSCILFLFAILMLYIGYSNWRSANEYLHSERVKTLAIIHEDENGVKTYNFSANSYGVVGNDPQIKDIGDDGDVVTIWYQKEKPYVVYRAKEPKWIWLDVAKPFFCGVLFLAFIYFTQINLRWTTRLIDFMLKKVKA